jgi:hypothetical protein
MRRVWLVVALWWWVWWVGVEIWGLEFDSKDEEASSL